jgi:hypothetical protein
MVMLMEKIFDLVSKCLPVAKISGLVGDESTAW